MVSTWRLRLWPLVAALLMALTPGRTWADPRPVTDARVQEAMKAMKVFLYANQDSSGGWDSTYSHTHAYPGAMTSLVTLALLVAGESPQQPQLARAIELLRAAEPLGTYQVALRAHVWAQLPDEYLGLLSKDVRWLAAAAYADGSFGYVPPANSAERNSDGHWYDNSNTQYGDLGLWEGAKRGVHAGKRFWQQSIDYWLGAQYEDGGWAYRARRSAGGFANQRTSYASMTCAGLTALYIGQEQMYGRRMSPAPQVADAIERGLAWLDQWFDGWNNVNGNNDDHRYYYLYSVERVALASGRRFFNDQPWFDVIAAQIVNNLFDSGSVRRSGGQAVKDTAFALMFLARGYVPVWITKLELDDVPEAATRQRPGARLGDRQASPGPFVAVTGPHPGASPGPQPTNNRPNDLTSLTRFLSDFGQAEINWQRLPLHTPVERWGACPVAYLASDEALTLSDSEAANLREFLDRGGLLVCNPDAESSRFVQSMRQLGQRLYPGRSWERLPLDHPLYNGHMVLAQPGQLVIEALGNGARDLIYLSQADLGYEWQASSPDVQSTAWRLGANLFTHATERGDLLNRLVPPMPPLPTGDQPVSRTLPVTRPRYDGLWCAEPLAWEAVRRRLARDDGLGLTLSPASGDQAVDLADLAAVSPGLAHLTGIEAVRLTVEQLDAIEAYVRKGGTVLVETVGGRGQFALSLEHQLAPRFGGAAMPLDTTHPLLTGDGIDGAADASRAVYRPYAVLRLSPGGEPRLLAFLDGERPAIIFSSEDLSLGMLGVRRWGILGYSTEYARQFMANLALWCAHHPTATPAKP